MSQDRVPRRPSSSNTPEPSQNSIMGVGAMAELVRAHAWEATDLGSIDGWPAALRTSVNLVLGMPIPSALFWGPELRMIYNDAYCDLLGLKHPGALGEQVRIVWWDAWPTIAPQLETILAGNGSVVQHEVLVPVDRHGVLEDVYWNYNLSPVYEEHGSICAVLVTCQEVTQAVLAERLLRASEARILASIGDAVIVTDASARVTRMNPVAEALTGWSQEAARGIALDKVFQIINESSRLPVESPGDKVRRLGTIVGLANHTILVRRDGTEVHIDDSGAPIRDDAGQLLGIVLVFRDITERWKQERELKIYGEGQRFLLDLSDQLRKLSDARVIMKTAAEATGKHLRVSRAGYGEISEDGAVIQFETGWTDLHMAELAGALPFTSFGTGNVAELQRGLTVVYDDVVADARMADRTQEIGVTSAVGVPILREGRLRAVFYVHCREAHHWSAAEVAILESVAERTTEAVERARIRQTLERSEEELRYTAELSAQLQWTAAPNGDILDFSPGWLSITGLTREQALGDGWSQLFHPEEGPRVRAAWTRVLGTGEPFNIEHRIRKASGDYTWTRSRAIASRDEEGRIVKWYGSTEDIDDLRRSEEKYRTLFNSIDTGYCVIEMLFDEQGRANDWRFLETNPAFDQQNPIPGMAIGKRMRELVPSIESKWFEIYGAVALTGKPLRFSEDSDALGRSFDLYAFRIGEESSHTVAVLFTNITQRRDAERALRDSEERFRALATASSDVIYRMDADWRRAQAVDGRSFLVDTHEPRENWMDSYIPTEDQAAIWTKIHKAIQTKSLFHLEHRVRRADGTIGWTISRAVPLFTGEGEISEWFGMATDVTERKHAEDALRKAEKLAVVGRLAATISHEINNPLEAVTNLLYLIEGEEDVDTIQRYATTAQQELARVSHIVMHTLKFSRQSTTTTEERLSHLLESSLAIYEGRIRGSGITLRRSYDECDAVLCYASELRQVFTNLIGNAFDAACRGGTLSLRTHRRRHEKTGELGVSVLIADTGDGMSAESLRRLFEPFFTTKGINGTGLGVWVSKSILDKHGACFRVKSSDTVGNSGTVWSIWMPLVPAG